jgi:hypothetical protein
MYREKKSYEVDIPTICDKDTEEARLAKELYQCRKKSFELGDRIKSIRNRLAELIEEAGDPINSIQTPEFKIVWCDSVNTCLSKETWDILESEFPDAAEWLHSRRTKRYLSVSPITK